MKLTLLTEPDETLDAAARTVAVRETLRAELAARGVVTRRWLVARVAVALQRHGVSVDDISAAIDELEDADDLVSGSHGRVAPTPLRVVDALGRHILVGTLPSVEWRLRGGPTLDDTVLPRLIELGPGKDAAQELASLVGSFGGACISLARWSGLDRVQAADEGWLEMVRGRAALATEPPSDDPDARWQCFAPASPGELRQRWHWSAAEAAPLLWRRFVRAGYSQQAWTSGGSPATNPWVRLSNDEALRTAFALAKSPVANSVTGRSEGKNVLVLTDRVPHAEYRWLVGAAESMPDARTFVFGATQTTAALDMLRARLGIEHLTAGQ